MTWLGDVDWWWLAMVVMVRQLRSMVILIDVDGGSDGWRDEYGASGVVSGDCGSNGGSGGGADSVDGSGGGGDDGVGSDCASVSASE